MQCREWPLDIAATSDLPGGERYWRNPIFGREKINMATSDVRRSGAYRQHGLAVQVSAAVQIPRQSRVGALHINTMIQDN